MLLTAFMYIIPKADLVLGFQHFLCLSLGAPQSEARNKDLCAGISFSIYSQEQK